MTWRCNGFYKAQLRVADLMARINRIRRIRKFPEQHLPRDQPTPTKGPKP